jgi:hypothetical protein
MATERVIDTLVLARRKRAGGHNTLVDLSRRTQHGALLDAELLAAEALSPSDDVAKHLFNRFGAVWLTQLTSGDLDHSQDLMFRRRCRELARRGRERPNGRTEGSYGVADGACYVCRRGNDRQGCARELGRPRRGQRRLGVCSRD